MCVKYNFTLYIVIESFFLFVKNVILCFVAVICESGFEAFNGECVQCPLGSYKAAQSVFECAACGSGQTTSTLGATSTDQCLGKYIIFLILIVLFAPQSLLGQLMFLYQHMIINLLRGHFEFLNSFCVPTKTKVYQFVFIGTPANSRKVRHIKSKNYISICPVISLLIIIMDFYIGFLLWIFIKPFPNLMLKALHISLPQQHYPHERQTTFLNS